MVEESVCDREEIQKFHIQEIKFQEWGPFLLGHVYAGPSNSLIQIFYVEISSISDLSSDFPMLMYFILQIISLYINGGCCRVLKLEEHSKTAPTHDSS